MVKASASSWSQLILHVTAEGGGDEDISAIVRHIEGWAGHEMPKTR